VRGKNRRPVVIGLNQIVVATALRHWGIDEKSISWCAAAVAAIASRAAKRPDRRNGAYRRFRRRAKAAGMPVLPTLAIWRIHLRR